MKRSALIAATTFAALCAPVAAQDVALTGITLATGDGSEPIADAAIVVRNGRVTYAGSAADMPATPSVTVVDGEGAWVTPGIFAAGTDLGLWDVGAVSESNDTEARNSPFSAALDVAPAINPASQHIAVSRAAGITRAAVLSEPSSSIFGGQGALIDMGADADPIIRARAFQVVTLGENGGRIAGGSRTSAHALFRNALREARQYGSDARIPGGPARPAERSTGDDLPFDPRMLDNRTERGDDALLTRFDAAALVPIVRGEQKLLVSVDRASDIRAVIDLKREFPQLDLVLVGAAEGWMVAPQIAAAGIPVLAAALENLPGRFESLASTQNNIGRMRQAGVMVGIYAGSMRQPRQLAQHAGNLVGLARMPRATGLSWGQALQAITSTPARIMGLGNAASSLTAGAAGDLVVWDGDPLEVGTMPVAVYIDGVEQPLENHQSRLRDRYRDLDESDLPKAYDW